MAVAEAAISFAVENIGNLIIQEAKLLYGVRSRVEELQYELKRMLGFLRDAESKQGGNSLIRNWVAEIRDIAYDAEDVLEIYALRAASSRRSSSSRLNIITVLIRSCTGVPKNIYLLHKVGSDIDDISARLTRLTSSLPTYGLKELKESEKPSSSENIKPIRRSYSHTIEQNVVGLENDTNLLLTKLVRPDCRAVSICGMAGLGKTTLAKKVHRKCKERGYFEFPIWVPVSQSWQARNIWETVLDELISPKEKGSDDEEKERIKIQKMKDDAVAKRLFKELRKKKCLVVLDDVGDGAWEVLKPAFPTEETETKYMITTRNKQWAVPNGYIHEPRCLNDEDSWELFRKTAIPSQKINEAYKLDPSMEKLGREMVQHCGGLPLAIVLLGGLLSSKTAFDEWYTIHQCIKSYLKSEELKVFELLALSYDDLPYEMKPCFLYLCVLPEDSQISRDRLINLWVAEGIIYPPRIEREGEEALEDIAYRYLTELAERYMVQVERDSIGRIKRCQMHDVMREFCLNKAEEENFFRVLPISDRRKSLNLSSSSAMVAGKCRGLAVHLSNFSRDATVECEEYPPFRSLLGFSLDRRSEISQPLMETFVRSFKLLRVLDLERVRGFCLPTTIGKLIHLRLLNLRSAGEGDLPQSIGNLSCLLTLRLKPLMYLPTTLPNVFWKLKRLRHLYLPHITGRGKKRLQFADLSDLRTLVNFQTSYADVDDLISLTNLRKLKIVISDENALLRFKAIFQSRTITFNYLRDFSIILVPSAVAAAFKSQDVDNIKSRCPRLMRLKLNRRVVYQKESDIFRLEEG